MAIYQQSSLYNQSNASPIASALEWINGVLLGPVAVSLCVLAVAFVGFAMLTGRWPLRLGFRVVLGCFVLFGAPVIAAGLMSAIEGQNETVPFAEPVSDQLPPRGDLPPASHDPYSGA